MPQKRNHDRAAGQTAISFSCSENIKKKLQQLADKDDRTLSNFLQVIIKKYLEEFKGS
jgi:predicted DNA-binding protein